MTESNIRILRVAETVSPKRPAPLASGERGIVVSVPLSSDEDGGMYMESEFDEQLMRTWLLFWDKLDIPENDVPLKVTTGLERYLETAGVLDRSHVAVNRALSDAEVLVWPHLEAFRVREEADPGAWALAMGPQTFSVPESRYAAGPGLEVRLTGVLPVPDMSVPYDDILAFKGKRRTELAALRDAIDEISEGFLDDPRRPLAEQAAVARFARRAVDALEITQEAGFSTRLLDIAARFSLVGAQATLGAVLPIALGGSLPEIVGNGLLAGASATIGEVAGGFGRRSHKTPFAYVLDYHAEVFPPE